MIKGSRIAVALLGGMLVAAFSTALPAFAEDGGFTPIPVIKGLKALENGDAAPDFSVKDLDGKVCDFSEERTKRAHLLVFWSIFCEPCREEMPVIQRIADEFQAAGTLGVLAVNMDGEPFIDGIKGFMNLNKYNLRILLDELDDQGDQFAIADPYQVAGTPLIYLVDAGGKIAGNHAGRISEGDLRAMVTRMLGEK